MDCNQFAIENLRTVYPIMGKWDIVEKTNLEEQ
jgi:hypothetical protein